MCELFITYYALHSSVGTLLLSKQKTAPSTKKGIEIGVEKTQNESEGVGGKAVRGSCLDMPDDDFEGQGRGKNIEQEVAGNVVGHI